MTENIEDHESHDLKPVLDLEEDEYGGSMKVECRDHDVEVGQ